MFCVIRKGKGNMGTVYKFYLCERIRMNGKIKSSDKYIVMMEHNDVAEMRVSSMAKILTAKVKEKEFGAEEAKAIDLVFEKYMDLRTGIKDAERSKEEAEFKKREEEARERSNQWQKFNDICSDIKISHYNEKEKEYLKIIYKAAALKLHPDATKGDDEGMKFLNKLKEEWGIQ